MMEDTLSVAYAVAKALSEGKTLEELTALQIRLQAISSLVAAEIASMRLTGKDPRSDGGAGK